MSEFDQLKARQHTRTAIELDIEFVIRPEDREQVQFSGQSSATQGHVIRGITSDISPGGVGMICRQFLPRMCEGTIRIFDPDQRQGGENPNQVRDMISLETEVRVSRVTMLSHSPTYNHGLAFTSPCSEIDKKVNDLVERVERLNQPLSPVEPVEPPTDTQDPISPDDAGLDILSDGMTLPGQDGEV